MSVRTAPRRTVRGPGFETWQALLGTAYRGLALSVCLSAAGLPLASALIVLVSPERSVPFLLLCALPLGPGFAAAFDALAGPDGGTPFAAFLRGLRRHGLRALAVWALVLAVVLVAYVDVVFVAGTPFALLLGPLFAVVGLLAVAAAPVALALVMLSPATPWWRSAGAGLFTALRRPLPSLLGLAILVAWTLILAASPVIGALVLSGFVATLLWMNAHAQLVAVGAVRGAS